MTTEQTLYTEKHPEKKEPWLPTPDWRTLSRGDLHSSDLFTEQAGYNDANVTGWDGRNVFGVTIGLVQMHVNLAMIPGNMSNATTFDFPILYRRMNAEDVADVMAEVPTKNFADAIVEAAQWLELQGVRAIMGNCGFFGGYQNEVKARINVPFFSSSLMMLPMMVHSHAHKQEGWRHYRQWAEPHQDPSGPELWPEPRGQRESNRDHGLRGRCGVLYFDHGKHRGIQSGKSRAGNRRRRQANVARKRRHRCNSARVYRAFPARRCRPERGTHAGVGLHNADEMDLLGLYSAAFRRAHLS